jgi:hypothetical protein
MSHKHFFHFQKFHMNRATGILIGLGVAGIGVAWLVSKGSATNQEGNQVATTPEQQRAAIVDLVTKQLGASASPDLIQTFATTIGQMSDQEVSLVYQYLFNYWAKGVPVPDGTFKDQIQAISDKYQIFT